MHEFGIRLRDVPRTVGWSGLAIIVRHLPPTSALSRAMHPEYEGWTREEMMLADTFDAIRSAAVSIVGALAGKRLRDPKPYPRPWARDERQIGAGAIPVKDFWKWWEGA